MTLVTDGSMTSLAASVSPNIVTYNLKAMAPKSAIGSSSQRCPHHILAFEGLSSVSEFTRDNFDRLRKQGTHYTVMVVPY